MNKSKSNLIVTVITAVVAIAAMAAVIYVLATGSHKKPDPVWAPDDAYYTELDTASDELLANNYKVFATYMQYGLNTAAPAYNTTPADGAYFVKDEEFTSFADIERIVNSTFVEAEATRIIENCIGTGQIYAEKEGKLVMYKDLFTAKEYDLGWSAPLVTYKSPTPDSVELSIELDKVTYTEDSEVPTGEKKTLTVTMLKEGDSWKLAKLIY